LVTRIRKKEKRRKISLLTRASIRSIVKFANKVAKLYCATPVQGRTIFVVSIPSSKKLPKESGLALIARSMGQKMRKLTRTTNIWNFAEFAKKVVNCFAVTRVLALTILSVAILRSMTYPMESGLALVVPWLHFKERLRKY